MLLPEAGLAKGRAQVKAAIERQFQSVELYRFGGLQGLRKRGNFKEVSVVDPFQRTMLHFPSPLAADNWLVSCFGRSLICTVPNETMYSLDRGQVRSAVSALHLETGEATVADFIARDVEAETGEAWEEFQIVTTAHGFRPELRTLKMIRGDAMRLRSLKRMRLHLAQNISDPRGHRAIARVERYIASARVATVGELLATLATEQFPAQAIECAAISLYRLGAVDMNISEAIYGNETSIQLV